MDRKKNVPKIRFQNFEDEWLDSTIGRHISLLNGRAYKQEELLDEGKYKVLRVGNFNTNSKWYYSNLELEENKYVNKGDLLYLWATNFGPEIWTEEKAIYHYHIWKLEFDRTEINQDYLNIWLESDKNKIQQNTNGSTMVHITKTMMEERGISLPNFDEQSAIGSLFRTLDELLASYKDNLTNYQSLKATMLSKMFPKAGQTVPEIRLDGFEGEWENIRLGDCAIIKGRLGWKSLKQEEYTEVGPSMIAGKHIKNGVIDWGEVDHIPQWRYDESPDIMLENGDVIFSKDGSLGNPALVSNLKGEATINSTMMLVRLTKKVSPQFFYQVLTSSVFQKLIYLKVSGSSIPHLFQADMQDFRFFAPCIEEQQVIGTYFSNLDNLISANQEKISQLETLKKKLLQNMFI